MSEQAIELNGILLEDGTIVLERVPALSPGAVRVRVEVNEAHRQTHQYEEFQRFWAERRAAGYVPRSREEVDAEIAAMRDENEERMLAIEQASEEARKARQEKAS